MITKPLWKKGREPWPAFNLIAAAMAGTALVSAVALDFINSRRGEPSYLFGPPAEKPVVVAEVKPPYEAGAKPVPPPAPEAKREPAPAAKEKEVAVKEAPPKETAPKEAPVTARRRIHGQVALIVDDMGNSMEALEAIVGLKEAVTVAVLPYSPLAQETARAAHDNNLEVLLHLPLESLNNHDAATDTEGMITAAMSPDEIVQSFETSLARVPYAAGVNNHMGSKFTADAGLMRTLLLPLKEKGLFFVDSRTSAQSVAYKEALRMGVPAVERNIFLDADADRSRIRSRLVELFKLARKKGWALGICHPYPETLEALRTSFSQFADYDLEVVPVSRLAQR
jgi:polysaccharide deacetylase 2 family uncharacterized protein YibQ